MNSTKEVFAFMADVTRTYGDDDPLVANLGEQAAMMVYGHYKDLSP